MHLGEGKFYYERMAEFNMKVSHILVISVILNLHNKVIKRDIFCVAINDHQNRTLLTFYIEIINKL